MLEQYRPILFFVLIVLAFAAGNLLLSEWLGKRFPARGKRTPYECGLSEGGPERTRFSVHFYLIAVLFILFDVEAIFLIPWAVAAKSLGAEAFVGVLSFLGVLGVGLAYVWKKGGLEWPR